ncbi:RHS repeat-associated core domain-containing protein [Streptomyces sp. NPDC050504]|uniref:RHS repeat-associated core domain-containing protein n=1 Tax=Streptomyces sp. NPDC050504 TaxID=3365618 RepID=UPI00378CC640
MRAAVLLALSVVLTVPATGLTPVAQAADGGPGRPTVAKPRVSKLAAANGEGAAKIRARLRTAQARDAASEARAVQEQRTATWPKPGRATVRLTAPGTAATAAAPMRRATAGGLPVTVAPASGRAPAPGSITVDVLDRRATDALGVTGVLLTAEPDKPGRAKLTVDYSSFAASVGGGWSGRLRLVQLPACALTTPKAAKCQSAVPLPTTNNATARTLTSDVSLAGGATLFAVTAAGSGQSATGTGDHSATPLAASSSWESGGSSGSFTWSYPMDPPKPAAGPSPSLKLSYDSGSIDGRTAATNNQGTSLGEGFDFSAVSYIERQYGSCDKDGHDDQYDLCWKYENASLVLNGRSTELVKDDTSGKWRLKNDDASTVTLETGTGNGDDNGERWTVVTGDGTKYVFGMNKLDGAPEGERTNSVWTVPVFGDDAGEPGYANGDTFGERAVDKQAWRWNLDYVEDTHDNAMSYWYIANTNHYRKNKASTADTAYTNSGYLSKILYGQRSGSLFTVKAPYQVTFGYDERCTVGGCTDLTEDTAKNWPDVPFDAICSKDEAKADCLVESPAFYSRKRLTQVDTYAYKGAAYTPVDSWALTQRFDDGQDRDDPSDQTLVLKSIQRTGRTGTPITTDPIDFTYSRRPNRVAGGTQPGGGNIAPLTRPRVETVTSETGAVTTVTYSGPECVRGSSVPTAEDNNETSCYPQYWHVNGAENATLDWFHKYRVTAVNVADPTGPGELMEYAYTYENPAWHYNDSPLAPGDERTWSVWRGYQKVTVRTGAATGPQSRTVTSYFQGMHGDRLKSGAEHDVNVPGIDFSALDVPDAIDFDHYAGFTRQQITYNDTVPVSTTVNDPWSRTTAIQHKSYADAEARYVRTARTLTHTFLNASKKWRTNRTETKYDDYGMAFRVDNTGGTEEPDDDTCTRTWYARNDAEGINSLVSRTRTVARPCGTAETDLKLPVSTGDRGNVLADTATVYDAATAWSADQKPTQGEATWTGRAAKYPAAATAGERHPTEWQTTTKVTYDGLGRAQTATDAAGNTTTTAYAPIGAGVPNGTTVTMPLGIKTTITLDGLRGVPLVTLDTNSKKTEQTYDGLGRLTGVWLPNRDKALGQSASMTYAYTLARGKAPAIATSTIKSSSTVATTYEIFDSLLRPLQTQKPTPNGGRLLTDTRYDSRGLAKETYADAFDTTKTPNAAYQRLEYGGSPKQTNTVYDSAGRATTSTFLAYGVKKWETASSYTGDSTATSAPVGGQATRVITDALGRTTERREYAGPSPEDKEYGGALGTSYTKTSLFYTPDGKQSKITGPDGSNWEYGYDLFGRQTSAKDPDKGTTTTGYTVLNQVDWSKDSADRRLVYGYDALGRKTDLWHTESKDANKLASWTFDTLVKGQQTSSTRYDGGKAYTKSVTEFDVLNRATKTQLSIDVNDPLVVAKAAQATYDFATTFNLDGTVRTTTEPAAGGLSAETIDYRYTATGQPTQVFSGTSGYLQAARYSAIGQPQMLTLAVSGAAEAKKTDLVNEYEEGTDRLKRSYVTMAATAPYKPQDLSYTYDEAGNVTKIADTPNPDPSLKTDVQCFTYDGHRRLTEAWTPSANDCTSKTLGGAAPYRTQYTYTAGGQRATETETPVTGTPTKTTYCYPEKGQPQPHTLKATTKADCKVTDPAPTATYTYDATGNTTRRPGPTNAAQTLTWNAEGKLATLTEGTKETSYLYDTEGTLLIRRAATGDGESVLYLGATEIHHKVTGTTKKTWATRSYLKGVGGAVRSNESGVSQLSFIAGDSHGTGTLKIDSLTQAFAKRQVTPFGAPRGPKQTAWPNDKAFLGKPADTTTGLTHIGAREYDPVLGQFISADPALVTDQHQALNGFAYANQNPVTYSDPTGLWIDDGTGRSEPRNDGHGDHNTYSKPDDSDKSDEKPRSSVGGVDDSCDAACQLSLNSWKMNLKVGVEDVSSQAVLHAWVLGVAPKRWIFSEGDEFTQEIREQRWLVKVRSLLGKDLKGMKVGSSRPYDRRMSDLSEVGKLVQVMEDLFGLASGQRFTQDESTFNLSSTALGSYSLSARLDSRDVSGKSARVSFTLKDTMTRESMMRMPTAKGYSEGDSFLPMKVIADGLKKMHPAGQKPVELYVSWSETIEIK